MNTPVRGPFGTPCKIKREGRESGIRGFARVVRDVNRNTGFDHFVDAQAGNSIFSLIKAVFFTASEKEPGSIPGKNLETANPIFEKSEKNGES